MNLVKNILIDGEHIAGAGGDTGFLNTSNGATAKVKHRVNTTIGKCVNRVLKIELLSLNISVDIPTKNVKQCVD